MSNTGKAPSTLEKYALMMLFGLGLGILLLFIVTGVAMSIGYLYG
tara:strand:- start:684 stop:818 length:135 start_codon:yes stop_codon:yes gene_type:complete